jgi:hypothetical protein
MKEKAAKTVQRWDPVARRFINVSLTCRKVIVPDNVTINDYSIFDGAYSQENVYLYILTADNESQYILDGGGSTE